MNITSLSNQQATTQLEEANVPFVTKVFNRIIRIAPPKKIAQLLCYSTWCASYYVVHKTANDYPTIYILGAFINLSCVVMPVIIECCSEPKIDQEYLDTNNPVHQQSSNNPRNLRDMIIGSHGSFAQINRIQEKKIEVHYKQLQELPPNYTYEDSDICYITWEPLGVGDTVCCDKKLYSFKALYKNYKQYKNDLIPHNRQPLDWNNNVYKLPKYGVLK